MGDDSDAASSCQVHLINLTGLKKRESTAERLRFCDEVLPDVLDSADYPLAVSYGVYLSSKKKHSWNISILPAQKFFLEVANKNS